MYNLKMREKLIAALTPLFLLVHKIPGSDSSVCYLDHYKGTLSNVDQGQNCTATKIFTENCGDFRDEKYTSFNNETNKEKLELSTHSDGSVVKVMISNISFHKLDIRIEDLTSPVKEEPYCQTIEFDGNQRPQEFVFHTPAWFRYETKIQFIGHCKDFSCREFFREFYFKSPTKYVMKDRTKININRIFAYIDTTYTDEVSLYVQPLPKDFHIDHYRGEFRQILDNNSELIGQFNPTNGPSVHDMPKGYTSFGFYYFKLIPVHANGTVLNSSYTNTASFNMTRWAYELYILMVCALLMPVALFFILRQVYTRYRNEVQRNIKVYLLLVYSPTHPSHVKVVKQLALYLKSCNLNVMIDEWGIEERQDLNPSKWCAEAFKKADVVVVVSSPDPNLYAGIERPIYRFMDQEAFRLIDENYHRKDKYKRYVAVLLPYCKKQDIPPVARKFKHVKIPEQSKKLVDICYDTDYTKLFDTWKKKQELIKSIDFARTNILQGEPIRKPKSLEGLNKFTFSGTDGELNNDDDNNDYNDKGYMVGEVSSDNSQQYQTKLDDLQLSGESSESESEDEKEDTLNHKSSLKSGILMV